MRNGKAISILELIVVVVAFCIIAVLAIPRLGRAATAPDDVAFALRSRLKVLRVAIERYHQDHGVYPGATADGLGAGPREATFIAQLTRFTDQGGRLSDVKDEVYRFGPYLRDGIPPCPVPPGIGDAGVQVVGDTPPRAASAENRQAGWIYDYRTGQISASSNASDTAGRSYVSY